MQRLLWKYLRTPAGEDQVQRLSKGQGQDCRGEKREIKGRGGMRKERVGGGHENSAEGSLGCGGRAGGRNR